MEKIWAHSGDSHFLEPDDLWKQILPPKAAERMPRSEKIGDDEEIVHVDGTSFRRKLPKIMTKRSETGETIAEMSARPPGARDMKARLVDLDSEGIWGEVVYSSLGMWFGMIRDRQLVAEAARAQNEWIVEEIQGAAPDRLVGAAQMPMLAVEDAVAEVEHAAAIGLKVLSLPTGVPPAMDDYQHDSWEPVWSAAEDAGLVVGFHIGTDSGDQAVSAGPAGRSSTTSRRRTAVSGRRRRWWRPVRWTVTRTSRCSSPRVGRRGFPSSATA
jgi:predicted TIM-barrel fold metal-dependent hydrolase